MLEIGKILSERYQILEKIGSGGMAIVFRGRDTKLERYVTIKVLRDEYIGDEDFISRFKSEATSAARLSHPNIVRVYDVGAEGDIYYIVMEYIHGDTLKEGIKKKAPFDTKSVLNVAIQMASALSHAHQNHVVHRDIKPQNILVGTDGIVKVTDFGIARAVTASTMTTTANALGSVHYFSPEQARGGYVDERSDIYSLGITMFEMATGHLPFTGNNSVAIALQHLNDPLPDMHQYNPEITKSLEGIIKKATNKKSDERYTTIDLLLADLLRARTDSTGGFIEEVPRYGAVGVVTDEPKKQVEFLSNSKKVVQEEAVGEKQMQSQNNQKSSSNGMKKIKISKDDDFEKEYQAPKPMKKSRAPKWGESKRRNPRQEENYSNSHEKGQEKKVIIAAVITALVIVAVISVFGMKLLGGSGGLFSFSKSEMEVPDFTGMSYSLAEDMAEEAGLKVIKEGEDYSKDFEKGDVLSQSISEGSMVKSGTEIGLKISLGLISEEMPEVVGKTEKVAKEKIDELVGATVTIEYEFDDKVEIGTVIAQTPEKGNEINAKSKITLSVSKGEEDKKVSVPQVEGLSESQAKKAIEANGLKVGNIVTTESNSVEKGLVITQTVSAGQSVAKDSIIGLVVSSGKAKVKESEKPEVPVKEKPEPEPQASSTRMFSVDGGSVSESAHVKVILTANDGSASTIVDETKMAADFPFIVSVTGSGKGKVQCYMDGALQWTESVNFSEGGN